MHTATSYTAAIDAGRQALPAAFHTTLSPFTAQSSNDTRVARSPVQMAVQQRSDPRPKMANARRSMLKSVTRLVNLIFGKSRPATDTRSPGPDGAAIGQDLMELKDAHQAACLVALQDEDNNPRLSLKAPIMPWCTPEQFDDVFPPSLQYMSKMLAEESRVWKELVLASERM